MKVFLRESFVNQFDNLHMREKEREEILDYFKNYTDEKADRDPYLKEEKIKMFKYHKYKQIRILYGYCKECFGTHSNFFNCPHCNRNDLEKVVLFGVGHRTKLYGKISPEKILKSKKL